MLKEEELRKLRDASNKTRINIITMVHNAKSGHIGGSLSCADILNVLYMKCLKIPSGWDKSPEYSSRDRFILSKGHCSPALYSVLAQYGFYDENELLSFRKFGSNFQGHPSKGTLPGIETSTGSLGQGISIACGIALGLKIDKNPAKVVVLTGDGELQEGSCWEGFMEASHRQLNNLIVFIDRNRLQIDGNTETVMGLDNLNDKFRAFNWNVLEINGHDYNQIYDAYNHALRATKPCAIIANTIKGKGVSFMENQAGWHGKAPNDEQFKLAIKELKQEVQ